MKNLSFFKLTMLSLAICLFLLTQAELEERKWQLHHSPQGRWSIYLPEGWTFKAFSPDESIIGFVPANQDLPEVSIAFAFSNPMTYPQKLTAQQFITLIIIPAYQGKSPDFQVKSIAVQPDSVAEMISSATYLGSKVKTRLVCTLEYLYDPIVNVWYNFAYLAMVTAPPEEFSQLEPIAAQIVGSFRPTDKWLLEVRQSLAEGIATRMAMIRRTTKRIAQMELEQRMLEMQSSYKIGWGWIDALGGTVEMRNPTTGETWRVDDKYKYYYQKGSEILGTDDPSGPREPGWVEMKRVKR